MTTRLLILILLFAAETFGCYSPSCTKIVFARPCLQPFCIPRCTTVSCIRKVLLLKPPPPPPIVIRTVPVQRSCCTVTNFSCCRTIYGKK